MVLKRTVYYRYRKSGFMKNPCCCLQRFSLIGKNSNLLATYVITKADNTLIRFLESVSIEIINISIFKL